jgi:hypothetical protein
MIAFLGGLWTLFSGIAFFRNAAIDGISEAGKLRIFAIVLGILYMVVTAIEAFGLFAAATQKVGMVRIYALGSGLVVLLIAATGLIRIVIHFSLKSDIINLCTDTNNGRTVVFFGFWGPVARGTLTEQGARDWCNDSWSRGSWSEILAFLITTALAALMAAVAFSYQRQLLDPTSPANHARAPSADARVGGYPSHYNPPYDAGYAGYTSYGAPPNYRPPPGPPPRDDPFNPPYNGKPPGYVGGDGNIGYSTDDKGDGPSAVHFR